MQTLSCNHYFSLLTLQVSQPSEINTRALYFRKKWTILYQDIVTVNQPLSALCLGIGKSTKQNRHKTNSSLNGMELNLIYLVDLLWWNQLCKARNRKAKTIKQVRTWSMASVNKAKALLTGHALPFLGRVCTLDLPYHRFKIMLLITIVMKLMRWFRIKVKVFSCKWNKIKTAVCWWTCAWQMI